MSSASCRGAGREGDLHRPVRPGEVLIPSRMSSEHRRRRHRRHLHRSRRLPEWRASSRRNVDRAGRSDRGVAEASRSPAAASAAIDELLHGSTIAINTVLEQSGARTALVTTARLPRCLRDRTRQSHRGLQSVLPSAAAVGAARAHLRDRRADECRGRDARPDRRGRRRSARRRIWARGVEAVADLPPACLRQPGARAWSSGELRAACPDLFVTLSRTKSCANSANTSVPRPPCSTPSSDRA